MSAKQDRVGVRTAADLERKYDLASLVSIKKAVENSLQGVNKTNATLEAFMAATLDTLDNMQSQIDGNITTWFNGGVPTLDNYPASEWKTEEEKTNHIGDLYYDRATGYAYRFSYIDDIYQWNKIVDNDVVEALALANSASDTADSKRRVFTAKPVPPYDSGDLWFYNGEIYICQISKGENETYAEKDFIIATKYTDDTYAKQVGEELTVVKGTVTTIKEGMDSYKVEISSKINTVEKGLEAANTTITANTQEIDLRVKKDGVIGAINVSNEAVKISANKIDIEGAVTFSALATDVSNKINTASTDASSALTTATNANKTATTASSNASTAVATANSALSTANTANTNASAAVTKANTASSNASTAVTTANTANTNATSALNRATYHYGTCATAAATVAKVVTLSGFVLYTGAQVTVQFTYANTAANPTLNVNGTGAKNIRVNNANITSLYYWGANNTVTFIYNGTYWVMADTSANSIVASWCSANDKTLIDGGKIYTATLFSKDIEITGKFNATALAYVAPSDYEYERVNGALTGTVTLTNAEKQYLDVNGDGKINITDMIAIKAMMLGKAEYTTYANKVQSTVTAKIEPSNPDKIISLTTKTPWGAERETYFGINGAYLPSVKAGGVLAEVIETTSGANLDTINSNLAKTTYGIDDLSLSSNFSNDTLRFFAIKYIDRVLVSMVVKANVTINKSTWTTIVSGLPKISWTHPLKVINTTNQTRGTVECVYGADGSIVVITNANSNYLAANDGLVISGVVMI